MDNRTVGLIGGDETCRLLVETGHRLGVRVAILDKDGSSSPAGQIASLCLEGNAYDQPNKIFELQGISDLIVVIQKTSIEPLKALQQQQQQQITQSKPFPVFPSVNTVEIIQNKYHQRIHLQQYDLPVPACISVNSIDEILNYIHYKSDGYPIVIKSKSFMDSNSGSGRMNSSTMDFTANSSSGNSGSTLKHSITLYSDDDIEPAIAKLSNGNVMNHNDSFDHIYLEEMVSFVSELAVSIVKTKDDQLYAYPVVEFHRLSRGKEANNISSSYGTLVIAPAQISSAIQQAATDIAMRAVSTFSGVGVFTVELYLLADDAVVINEVLARPHSTGLYSLHACDRSQYEMHLRAILGLPCSTPRLLVPSTATLQLLSTKNLLEAKQCFQQLISHPGVVGTWYSNSVNQQLVGSRMGHVAISTQDVYELREKLEQYLGLTEKQHHIPKRPSIVAIVIESESQLSAIQTTCSILKKFGISFEISIISSYKTPTKLFTFAQSAVDRGVKVIITLDSSPPAGHLSSMITSLTTIPVLSASLVSTDGGMQPTGYPVAQLGPGGIENCAFLAARILSVHDKNLQQALEQHSMHEEEIILRESDKLRNDR